MNDPAVLFYTSDFLTGVMDLTMEERGQYITLLCYQHQRGHIKEETIRLLVGSISDNVLSKFSKDDKGLFFNERMDIEKENRRKFTESRRENGKKGGRPKKALGYPNGLTKENHMGNENEDINEEYIINLYINTINNSISSIEYEKLNNYIEIYKEDLNVIVYAIEYCKMYKAYNINYLCKILNNWHRAGYKTLNEIKTHETQEKEKQSKLEEIKESKILFDYDWLNDDEEEK